MESTSGVDMLVNEEKKKQKNSLNILLLWDLIRNTFADFIANPIVVIIASICAGVFVSHKDFGFSPIMIASSLCGLLPAIALGIRSNNNGREGAYEIIVGVIALVVSLLTLLVYEPYLNKRDVRNFKEKPTQIIKTSNSIIVIKDTIKLESSAIEDYMNEHIMICSSTYRDEFNNIHRTKPTICSE